ncbi:MAG: HAMP domain-containing protein [Candidatus Thiodiazotropha sp. (ex Monitilora ramsayi)]|nr:HAMP domain-containing protein [Candidatus Thiodiazotropha sp. (ex Monitilora ramsayi)]
MGVITVLAVAGMASAVFVARITYGEASAVNIAGSLRMQSYRIAAALESRRNGDFRTSEDIKDLISEFESRFNAPQLTDSIAGATNQSLQTIYSLVESRWRLAVKPQIIAFIQEIETGTSAARLDRTSRTFHTLIKSFVNDVDKLVHQLEEDAESRIHLLGLMQSISLLLTLMVAAATLYLMQTDIVSPLRDLLSSAEKAGEGDLSVRVGHTGPDELGRLGQAFNTMAIQLSRIYEDLEQRVDEKTQELTQRNNSLELLYDISRGLTKAPISEPTYRKMLTDIAKVVDVKSITLCLLDHDSRRAHRLANSGTIPPMCETANCKICIDDGKQRKLIIGDSNILSIPVSDQEQQYGVLLIEYQIGNSMEPWQTHLLNTLGRHIGIAIGVTRRINQRRRLALLDERSVIARELHDSLAQSLSYLKIQVARLSILIKPDEVSVKVAEVMAELEEGLDASYRQLRELLTTFRLKMDENGLTAALSETVEGFRDRSNLDINLDNRISGDPLSVNEEIHVLQIVREALSNITYHAKATKVVIRLTQNADSEVIIDIEDDGIGIPPQADRTHHYGLAIMRERANSLNAEIQIEPRSDKGTRVRLHFQPKNDQPNFNQDPVEI